MTREAAEDKVEACCKGGLIGGSLVLRNKFDFLLQFYLNLFYYRFKFITMNKCIISLFSNEFERNNQVWGRLQRTSVKISDFQTTLPPLVRVCPNFQNHPPPRTSASGFFNFYTFLFLLIKTKFIAQFLFLSSLKC